MRKTIIVEKDGNQYLIELDKAAFTCYRNMFVHVAQLDNLHEFDPDIPVSKLIRGIILPNSHNIHCGSTCRGSVVLDLQYSPNEVLLDDLPIEDRQAILSMFDENELFYLWLNVVVCNRTRMQFDPCDDKRTDEYVNSNNPFILTEFIQQGYKWLPYIDSDGVKKFSRVLSDSYHAPFFLMPNAIIACFDGSVTKAGTAYTVYGHVDFFELPNIMKLRTLKSFHEEPYTDKDLN